MWHEEDSGRETFLQFFTCSLIIGIMIQFPKPHRFTLFPAAF